MFNHIVLPIFILMKSVLLYITFIILARYSFAQKEYPNCEETFFKTGELSTKKCFDKEKRFGKATAFNKKSEIIYEKDLRTIGGHASLSFSYYPNGAVQKAEWSSAPDAGIQWYNTTDVFDENGKKISHTENNYDDYLRVTTPYLLPVKDTIVKQSPVDKTKKDTIITDKNFIEVWGINHTYYPVIVMAKDKQTYIEMAEKTILPGDSIKIIQYKYSKAFNEPNKKYRLSVAPTIKHTDRNPSVKYIKKKKQKLNDIYYYIIQNK